MVDDRRRRLADVAVGEAVLPTPGQPLADKALREVAAVRAVLILAGEAGAGAGVQVQDMWHVESPFEVEFICYSQQTQAKPS